METNPHTPLASFIDLMMDAVFAVDTDSRIVFVSAACERIFGYTPQELVGRHMLDLVAPQDRDSTRQSAQDVMGGQPQLHFENRYVHKDGRLIDIMWSARWSPADQLRIGVARDITERKQAEARQAALYAISEAAQAAEDLPALLRRIHDILGRLLPAENFSVALHDPATGQLSFPYRADQREQGATPPQPAAGTLCARVIESGQPLLLEAADDAPAEWQCWLGVPLKSANGTIGTLVLKSYPGGARYGERDRELLQFVSTQIATAIERQRMQARLLHMAQYDWLTDLPNRGLLHDRLKTALARARRERSRLALLYLDLDKFKQINDRLGHAAGDRLLRETARRLRQSVRASDTVARLGGDEFVVLLENLQTPADAALLADKLRTAVAQPLEIDGEILRVLPSIGIATCPEHGTDEEQLLRHADQAMYAQKKARLAA